MTKKKIRIKTDEDREMPDENKFMLSETVLLFSYSLAARNRT